MAHNDTKPQFNPLFSHRKQPQSFGRRCGLCELPLDSQRPAISLKSGSRVHLECYYMLQKRAGGT